MLFMGKLNLIPFWLKILTKQKLIHMQKYFEHEPLNISDNMEFISAVSLRQTWRENYSTRKNILTEMKIPSNCTTHKMSECVERFIINGGEGPLPLNTEMWTLLNQRKFKNTVSFGKERITWELLHPIYVHFLERRLNQGESFTVFFGN